MNYETVIADGHATPLFGIVLFCVLAICFWGILGTEVLLRILRRWFQPKVVMKIVALYVAAYVVVFVLKK